MFLAEEVPRLKGLRSSAAIIFHSPPGRFQFGRNLTVLGEQLRRYPDLTFGEQCGNSPIGHSAEDKSRDQNARVNDRSDSFSASGRRLFCLIS